MLLWGFALGVLLVRAGPVLRALAVVAVLLLTALLVGGVVTTALTAWGG